MWAHHAVTGVAWRSSMRSSLARRLCWGSRDIAIQWMRPTAGCAMMAKGLDRRNPFRCVPRMLVARSFSSSVEEDDWEEYPEQYAQETIGHHYRLNGRILQRQGDVHAILELVGRHVHEFNGVNCGTAMLLLAKACRGDYSVRRQVAQDPRLQMVIEKMREQLEAGEEEFSGQSFSNIVHGLADFGYTAEKPRDAFLDALVYDCATDRFRIFSPQDVGMFLNGLGKLDYRLPDHIAENFVNELYRHCLDIHFEKRKGLLSFDHIALHNLALGLCRMKIEVTTRFIDKFIEGVVSLRHRYGVGMEGMGPAGLSCTVHSLSVLKAKAPPFFCMAVEDAVDKMAVDGLRGLKAFEPRALTFLLLGLANMGLRPSEEFLKAVDAHCVKNDFDKFLAQDLTLLITAFSQLMYKPSRAMQQGFVEACRRQRQGPHTGFHSFSCTQLGYVTLGWGILRCEVPQPVLRDVVDAVMTKEGRLHVGPDAFPREALARLIKGLGLVGWEPDADVCRALAMSCVQEMRRFGPLYTGLKSFGLHGVSQIVIGLGALDYTPPDKFQVELEKMLLSVRLDTMRPWQLSNLVAGLVGMRCAPRGVLSHRVVDACLSLQFHGKVGLNAFPPDDLRTLVPNVDSFVDRRRDDWFYATRPIRVAWSQQQKPIESVAKKP